MYVDLTAHTAAHWTGGSTDKRDSLHVIVGVMQHQHTLHNQHTATPHTPEHSPHIHYLLSSSAQPLLALITRG